jgi:hypothetical protein
MINGVVWQTTLQNKVMLFTIHVLFFYFFIFFNNNQHQNILTFFIFYITSIIFYYYSNKQNSLQYNFFFFTFLYKFFLLYITSLFTNFKINNPLLCSVHVFAKQDQYHYFSLRHQPHIPHKQRAWGKEAPGFWSYSRHLIGDSKNYQSNKYK